MRTQLLPGSLFSQENLGMRLRYSIISQYYAESCEKVVNKLLEDQVSKSWVVTEARLGQLGRKRSVHTQPNQWPFPQYWWLPYPGYPAYSRHSGAPLTSCHALLCQLFLLQWFQRVIPTRRSKMVRMGNPQGPVVLSQKTMIMKLMMM